MATTSQMLAEARQAYHELATGKAVVEVRDSSGESVRYTRANLSQLRNYIKDLEETLRAETMKVSKTRFPMRFQF